MLAIGREFNKSLEWLFTGEEWFSPSPVRFNWWRVTPGTDGENESFDTVGSGAPPLAAGRVIESVQRSRTDEAEIILVAR